MVADVERITPDKVNIKIPKTIINELKRVNANSSFQRIEYAGKINFETSKSNYPQIKFNIQYTWLWAVAYAASCKK